MENIRTHGGLDIWRDFITDFWANRVIATLEVVNSADFGEEIFMEPFFRKMKAYNVPRKLDTGLR
jgi:hypothetical protein